MEGNVFGEGRMFDGEVNGMFDRVETFWQRIRMRDGQEHRMRGIREMFWREIRMFDGY